MLSRRSSNSWLLKLHRVVQECNVIAAHALIQASTRPKLMHWPAASRWVWITQWFRNDTDGMQDSPAFHFRTILLLICSESLFWFPALSGQVISFHWQFAHARSYAFYVNKKLRTSLFSLGLFSLWCATKVQHALFGFRCRMAKKIKKES